MNTIYRIIWNRAKGEWTVASELAAATCGGKGKAQKNVHASAVVLRRLPWVLACVLGGLAVCAPVVHASDTAAAEHQQMAKINSRLADLSGLLVKYGHAGASVARHVASSTIATHPSVLPNQRTPVAPATESPAVQLSAVTTGHIAIPPKPQSSAPHVQAVVQTQAVSHVAAAAQAAASPAEVQLAAASHNALSPQLASDAQIAAVLAHGHAGLTGTSTANVTDQAAAWVVSSDGSLHAAAPDALTPKTSTWSGTAFTSTPAASASRSASSSAGAADHTSVKQASSLPAASVPQAAASNTSSAGQLAAVGAQISARVGSVADVDAKQAVRVHAPDTPTPPVPLATSAGNLVADVASTVSRAATSLQTTGQTLDNSLTATNTSSAGTDASSAETAGDALASSVRSATQAVAAGGSSPTAASVGTPERYMAVDAGSADIRQPTATISSANLERAATLAPAAAPAPAPTGAPVVPAPSGTPTGLIVSNGGVTGTVSSLLGTTGNALLHNSSPTQYITSGGLQVSAANITQGYGVLSVLGVSTVNLTPVGTLLTTASGAVIGGTGINSHLTLIGAVKSGNYISDINNGAAGGVLGLLLPKNAPAWAKTCASVAGIITDKCWAVNAAQDNQVLMGDGAAANGSEEVVIGTNASHTLPTVSANKVFPGDGTRTSSSDPMGVPNDDYQSREGHSVVIGDSASGTQNMQTILGANATSDQANSVALGYGSNADRGALTGYTDAYGLVGQAQNSVGEVAVGNAGHDRQITHVAAGTQAHDAVNVAQLEGATANATKGAVMYDKTALPNGTSVINYGSVTLAGITSTDGGVTNGTRITNVHQGTLSKTSTDAVNGSQLFATNNNVTNNTTNITKNIKNIYNLQQDALQWNPAIGAYDASHHSGSPQKISNVAAGTAPTDAANVSQLNGVSKGAVKYDSTTTNGKTTVNYDSVTLAGTTSTDGGVTNGTTISNLHQGVLGVLSTDAVNGSQLFATNNILAKYMGGVTSYTGTTNTWVPPDFTVVGFDSKGNPTDGHYDNVTDAFLAVDASLKFLNKNKCTVQNSCGQGGQNPYFKANSTGAPAGDIGKGSVAMGGDTVAKGDGSVAGGDGAQALSDGAVAIGQNATASNGQAVAIGPAANASGDGAVAIGDPNAATGNGAVAVGKDNTATGDGAVALGNTSTAKGTGAVAAGNNASATADGALALGNNASSTSTGDVALGAGSVAHRENVVSVGSAGHERQITNVADGTEDTDAVNLSQLKKSENGTVRYDVNKNGTINYNSVTLGQPGGGGGQTTIHNVAPGKADTDAVNVAQLDAVKNWAQQYSNQQYRDLSRHAFAGVASAMAMAGLPQAYLPGKNMASIAGGTFHGESSLAIGMSMISDNGRWVFKLSGSEDTQGDAGGSVGVGIQW